MFSIGLASVRDVNNNNEKNIIMIRYLAEPAVITREKQEVLLQEV